ncbi:MAG: hypothetical protein MZV64_62395 [Ignavibacteriales bacterium]|nr:hypothetical protein [Ignavibacteriales bacterium]
MLRALLGLLPLESGEIRWNGSRCPDPGDFFIPPRCAYTAQVPRLFSNTLRNNILLGLDRSDDEIYKAANTGRDGPRPGANWTTTSKRWSARAASNSPAGRRSAPPPRACSSASRNCSSSTTSPARWMWRPSANYGSVYSSPKKKKPVSSSPTAALSSAALITSSFSRMERSNREVHWASCLHPAPKCASCGTWRKAKNRRSSDQEPVKRRGVFQFDRQCLGWKNPLPALATCCLHA